MLCTKKATRMGARLLAPSSELVPSEMAMDIAHWLRSLGLEQYEAIFRQYRSFRGMTWSHLSALPATAANIEHSAAHPVSALPREVETGMGDRLGAAKT